VCSVGTRICERGGSSVCLSDLVHGQAEIVQPSWFLVPNGVVRCRGALFTCSLLFVSSATFACVLVEQEFV
jgi:hypothetical protein